MFRNRAVATLLSILLPMLATCTAVRLYLHLVNYDLDLVIAGREVHHLFTGALLVIPAAFVLAFPLASRWAHRVALVALGTGSGLVLDEVVYLIATDGTNRSYVTPVSLWGSVILVGLAVLLLVGLCAACRR